MHNMSELDAGQLAQVRQAIRDDVLDSDGFYEAFLQKVESSEEATKKFDDYLEDRYNGLNKKQPKFYQKEFYGRKTVLGTASASLILVAVTWGAHIAEFINVPSIIHTVLRTETFMKHSLDVASPSAENANLKRTIEVFLMEQAGIEDVETSDTLEAILQNRIDQMAAADGGQIKRFAHQAVRERPVLVYSDRQFLSVGRTNDLSPECEAEQSQAIEDYATYTNRLADEQSKAMPDLQLVQAFNASLSQIEAKVDEITDRCTKMISRNEISVPFYSEFGDNPERGFEVYAIVHVSVPTPAARVSIQAEDPEFIPLPLSMSSEISFHVETNEGLRIDLTDENVVNQKAGKFTLWISREYWDNIQANAAGQTSEIFHAMTAHVDDQVILDNEIVVVHFAIFLNKSKS